MIEECELSAAALSCIELQSLKIETHQIKISPETLCKSAHERTSTAKFWEERATK